MQHLDKHNHVPYCKSLNVEYKSNFKTFCALSYIYILLQYVWFIYWFKYQITPLFVLMQCRLFVDVSLSLSWYKLWKTNKIYMKMWAYMTYALYHMGQTRGLLLYTVRMQRKRNKSSFTWHVYDFQDRISNNLIKTFRKLFTKRSFRIYILWRNIWMF